MALLSVMMVCLLPGIPGYAQEYQGAEALLSANSGNVEEVIPESSPGAGAEMVIPADNPDAGVEMIIAD